MAAFNPTGQIAAFYRQAYTDMIRLNAMTLDSVLSDTLDQEPLRGEELNIYSYGQILPQPYQNRWADSATNRQETPRFVRKLPPEFWTVVEWWDTIVDPLQLMRDIRPDSNWTRQVNGGIGQRKDIEIITAFDEDIDEIPGVNDPATSPGAAVTKSPTIIAHNVAQPISGGTGATVDKVILAREYLEQNRAPLFEPWYCAIHPIQVRQLLTSIQAGNSEVDPRLINVDFAALTPLLEGRPTRFMGFEFRVTPDIPTKDIILTDDGRHMHFYTRTAGVLGTPGSMRVEIDELPQTSHAFQVAHYFPCNAIRRDEKQHVAVECLDAG